MTKFSNAVTLYVLGAIFSFGHAYSRVPDTDTWFVGQETATVNGPAYKSMQAALAVSGWPLYWSAILWEHQP